MFSSSSAMVLSNPLMAALRLVVVNNSVAPEIFPLGPVAAMILLRFRAVADSLLVSVHRSARSPSLGAALHSGSQVVQ